MVRQIRAMIPNAVCLTDHSDCGVDLPQIRFPGLRAAARSRPWQVPVIPFERAVADVFTSGSTGLPVPHRKRWGPLMGCMQVAAERFGFTEAQPMTVVGTVPPQHMYGF